MSEAGSSDPEHNQGSYEPAPRAASLKPEALKREVLNREAFRGPDALRPDKSGSAAVVQIHTPKPHSPAPGHPQPGPVTFNQSELRLIFGLYGRKVAAGEWRDYAMDFLRDQAIFSIYRRSSEVPLYRIEKTPRLARKQGEYAAVAASGLILKRGGDLARVLAVLDRPLKIVR